MGRQGKTAVMHLIDGTGRKDRHGKKSNVKKERPWSTPVELNPQEQARFNLMVKYLQEKGSFSSTHSTPLALLVKTESITAMAANSIKSEEDMIQVFKNGTTNISPELTAFKQSLKSYMDLVGEFGATPRAEQAIKSLSTGQMELPFEEKTPVLRKKA